MQHVLDYIIDFRGLSRGHKHKFHNKRYCKIKNAINHVR